MEFPTKAIFKVRSPSMQISVENYTKAFMHYFSVGQPAALQLPLEIDNLDENQQIH
jgi:hypothetical protein